MATGITHVLKRAACPRLHTYLRVLHSSCYTELEVSLLAFDSVHETGILATERATDGITYVVAECADPLKHVCIVLEGNFLGRICNCRSRPAFTVDNNIRVDGMKPLADLIHRFDVMDGHKVETETVDMIFLHPPLQGLDHIFAEHLLLGSGLVAAA